MIETVPVTTLTAMLGLLAVFQISLILGAPLGKFAWGGRHRKLSLNLRFAAASAVLRYVFVAFIAMNRDGTLSLLPEEFTSLMMWIIVAHFGLGVVLSAVFSSIPERATLAPYTFVMWLLSLLTALEA